jgi:predicted nucleic acid-binding protein
MKSVFADAYFFIALLNPRDAGHADALGISAERWQRIVTTEWVLAEVGNSLAATPLRRKFVELVDSLRSSENVEIIRSDAEWFQGGFDLYRRREDKHWSLTDCLSFTVMESLSLLEALTADRHFQQAGFVAVMLSSG